MGSAWSIYANQPRWAYYTDSGDIVLIFKELIDHFERQTIWVDTLCIDQTNSEEKSEQVAIMGEIYSQARGVFAWLGDGNTNFYFALNGKIRGVPEYNKEDIIILDECYEEIFMNLYWTRLWTLQERVLAKELWIVCGDEIVQWKEVKAGYLNLLTALEGDQGEEGVGLAKSNYPLSSVSRPHHERARFDGEMSLLTTMTSY